MCPPLARQLGEAVKVAIKTRFLKHTKKQGRCLVWTATKDDKGYGMFHHPGTGRKMTKAHRSSWLLFVGELEDSTRILHTCDNRACVNPKHLYPGNQKQNAFDRDSRGRNGAAKLKKEDVKAIRKNTTDSNVELARFFGVSRMTIVRVRSRETWTWVKK